MLRLGGGRGWSEGESEHEDRGVRCECQIGGGVDGSLLSHLGKGLFVLVGHCFSDSGFELFCC